ncbi:hypothetical protein ACWY4P_19025 [Streptomyces sp. LZ34]
MTTRLDDGPEFEPDDPLTVILRPTTDHLSPPPGQYEAIRRTATRRRLLRTAGGVGLACATAALIALPLHLAARETPAPPTVPLAPPTKSARTTSPTSTATPEPISPEPTTSPSITEAPRPSSPTRQSPQKENSRPPSSPAAPTRVPTATPTSPRDEPSKSRAGITAEPERNPQ